VLVLVLVLVLVIVIEKPPREPHHAPVNSHPPLVGGPRP
jgi:hypothetical protein